MFSLKNIAWYLNARDSNESRSLWANTPSNTGLKKLSPTSAFILLCSFGFYLVNWSWLIIRRNINDMFCSMYPAPTINLHKPKSHTSDYILNTIATIKYPIENENVPIDTKLMYASALLLLSLDLAMSVLAIG